MAFSNSNFFPLKCIFLYNYQLHFLIRLKNCVKRRKIICQVKKRKYLKSRTENVSNQGKIDKKEKAFKLNETKKK